MKTGIEETIEILETLVKRGLVEKRIFNGVTQWKITEKGKQVDNATLADLVSTEKPEGSK